MSRRLLVRCRAKINTVLRVLGRRPDGYHDLDTEFVSLELHDRLHLEPARRDALQVIGPRKDALGTDGDNLALTAIQRLRRALAPTVLPPIALTLEKRVPVAAGLGGGSSDAAGALVGALALHGLPIDLDQLAPIALNLGSDVPYFLRGGRQRGRARGDELEPLPDEPPRLLLLIRPEVAVSTARVFATHAETAGEGMLTMRKPSASLESSTEHAGLGPAQNDLWPAALKVAPVLSELKRRVEDRLPEAMVGLSGSGPTLFAMLPPDSHERDLVDAAGDLRGRGVETLPTRTISATEYSATWWSEGPGVAPGSGADA